MPADAAPVLVPTPTPTPAPPAEPMPPDRELPDYAFAEIAERSREKTWHFFPGWRRSRSGTAQRPSRAAVVAYSRIFVERLGAPADLVGKGDPGVARLLLRYADAVHARIEWYESLLESMNSSYQRLRATLVAVPIALLGFVAYLAWVDAGVESLVSVAVVGIVWFQLGLKLRNDKGHIDAYVTALTTLKKQLFAFEAQWDDKCWRASAWPVGFASALAAGIRAAEAVEEAERFATLRARVDGVSGSAESLSKLVEGLPAVATAQGALLHPATAPQTLTELQKAEIELEAARRAEEEATAATWSLPANADEYRKARIVAEAKVLRLRREEEALRGRS